MKIINQKMVLSILMTISVLSIISLVNNSYALPTNIPEITSVATNSNEENSLKISIKSNNTGTDYSFEILNITTNKLNVLSGSVINYTYQGLENGKEYKIMIRACSNDSTTYRCTTWSTPKSALVGTSTNTSTNTNTNTTNNSSSTTAGVKTYTIKYNANGGKTFKYLGHPKMSNLKAGDVLVKKRSHTMLYVGKGQIAEATSGDPWGAKSISVKKLTASRYKSYKVLRYLGH